MRFYVPPDSIVPTRNIVEIKDRTEVHHMRDVMRLKKGDIVDIFDGQGKEFSCVIEKINRNSIIIKIQDVKLAVGNGLKLFPAITLYQAIPKKNKMDFIVEKAVELGVETITPIITERTVPDIKDKASKKVKRWSRIAMASSKQCGRVKLPLVSNIIDFSNALLGAEKSDIVIFATLDKTSEPLKKILRDLTHRTIAVFVGPEGDFSPQEVSLARGKGYNICSLGNLILKSETAGIYILSCLSYELQ